MKRAKFAELAGDTLREELHENGVVAIWGTIGGVRISAQYDADNQGLYAVHIEDLDAERALDAMAKTTPEAAPAERAQLGSANRWKDTPQIVKDCRASKHLTGSKNRDPYRRGFCTVVFCDICGYEYTYDSSD